MFAESMLIIKATEIS